MYFERIIAIGFIAILFGVILIISGAFLSTVNGGSESHIQTGGVLLIGPIPIIFGNSKPFIIISIAGAVIIMAAYFLISRGEFI
jgi:uncharacterized protein (TIGR00304 family)